ADDEIDVDGINPRPHQRLAGGGNAKVGGKLAVFGDVPLLDSRPLADPSVAGIDPLRQIVIGEDALGEVRTDPADHRAYERHVLSLPSLIASLSTSLEHLLAHGAREGLAQALNPAGASLQSLASSGGLAGRLAFDELAVQRLQIGGEPLKHVALHHLV